MCCKAVDWPMKAKGNHIADKAGNLRLKVPRYRDRANRSSDGYEPVAVSYRKLMMMVPVMMPCPMPVVSGEEACVLVRETMMMVSMSVVPIMMVVMMVPNPSLGSRYKSKRDQCDN